MTASVAGPDAVALSVLRHRFASVAEEVAETLRRAALSPNVKERRDHSAAVMDGAGRMVAHAAAIPVHLGSQPLSVEAAIAAHGARWGPGDMVLLNDPYEGGTHLPDLTLVTPVWLDREEGAGRPESGAPPDFILSTRAHHADVGGLSPGSMPLSREVFHEGLRIPPVLLVRRGALDADILGLICANSRTPDERRGDLAAQVAANRRGAARLRERFPDATARAEARAAVAALLDHAEALTRAFLRSLPEGNYEAEDVLDDDGVSPPGAPPPRIRVAVRLSGGEAFVDFAGTSPAVPGPLNANRAIALAAVFYAFRAVAGARAGAESGDPPANAGMLRPIRLSIPAGSLLDPPFPAAVAGGNVETSQRVVDVLLAALAKAAPDLVPAASQGTMNNLTLGGRDPRTGRAFAYYETIGGGAGGGPAGPGAHAVHVHMTNTLNTPIEALERALPVRVTAQTVRRGSGGAGRYPGGDGIVREIEALAPLEATVLSERRRVAPPGLAGGGAGARGRNVVVRGAGGGGGSGVQVQVQAQGEGEGEVEGKEQVRGGGRGEVGRVEELPGKVTVQLLPGDRLRIETPGGGGWGERT